ncbi:T-cell-specific guanine nucleotide triphosphate-binding protein 2-like isoform X1 [Puntigrus tetrazona]|uniref:T-cell-specific guanine nucleotide triphosphate-binding protein 2-like isoform X1 n=1 Tax=Puntigrus tetrazona TaxID=1606681 RepID=UPI001C89F2C9|nr:T-cell-specific guanine nucleotide triphosphate-binding protein 2-like isoform X1 [Puntigrus tetrazona]
MLRKLEIAKKDVQTKCPVKSREKDTKKQEEEDKNLNVCEASREYLDILSTATANAQVSDSLGSEIDEIIDSPPVEKKNKLKNKLKELENVTLNIAITGMTGAGKSSLVNALRGLPNDHKDAAPTGTTETTMKPNMYPHPFMPNVKIWDLPGIGSPRFRAKKYLKDVNFHTYDFFLIVTSERFKENDIELARAIKKRKKVFYFIRTKIDNDIRAELHKTNFDERMLLETIREDCTVNLVSIEIPKIFLISSFQVENYDFPKLINTLEYEIPKKKKIALIQFLPVYSFQKNKLKEFENVTLNIAVTGMTGAGKSSLVNALRGILNDDKDAAPTGTETTMKPNMYPHPFMPNVKIWDLPGIGSPRFRAKKYLKDVNFHTYDFFLIVTSERFKENDIELARAIKKSKKLFYFIRTKIDNDIRAESNKRNFDERMLLDNIRKDCKANLLSVETPKMFLVSSFNLEKYDFQELIDTLEEELPENKKFALIQSLPIYSLEALTKKKTYYKKMIWLNALAAGVGAIPPIPGLSLACDYGIMKKFFQQVFAGFGLSNQALEVLSERVNKPVEQLKAARTSRFKDGATEDIVIDMLSKPKIAIAKTLGTVMSMLPGGALPAGGTAVATVHYLLNMGLNEMAEDTKRVLSVSLLA